MSTNHYSFFDYRKLIAWDKRLAREWAFLEKPLTAAPVRRVLDLGSGTGEHARFFASQGFAVVGVDVSDAMMDRAREGGTPEGVQFVQGDLLHVDTVVQGTFGAAVCLGNTLSHIADRDSLVQLFAGVRAVLAPGAPFILQMLNYEHFLLTGQRSLPLTFIEDEEGEAVFLRVMTFKPGGRVVFSPTVLRLRTDQDPALEIETSHNVELHGWTWREVDEALAAGGFADRQHFGAMADVPFSAAESHDLVVVAR
ncbi:MAG: class I SAM-dependent methyltransferase [Vicinamibacterales bacterium]|nr:class I SAM-dependent methyltransferase [Vicinamibacterales bacterium]